VCIRRRDALPNGNQGDPVMQKLDELTEELRTLRRELDQGR
jgi:hypothetical protein